MRLIRNRKITYSSKEQVVETLFIEGESPLQENDLGNSSLAIVYVGEEESMGKHSILTSQTQTSINPRVWGLVLNFLHNVLTYVGSIVHVTSIFPQKQLYFSFLC